MSSQSSPFLTSITRYMQVRRYSKRTINTYLHWIKRSIRIVQEQLGHHDVKTAAIYTHMLKRGASGVRSPLSDL